MKTISTFLFCCVIAISSIFAQKNCEYSYKVVTSNATYATTDAAMQTYIGTLGYNVTADIQSATTGFTVHVLSNSLGSGDAPFVAMKTTPEPVVMLKTWGIKSSGLGWSSAGAGVNMNALSVDITTAGSTHDITKGLGTSVALFSDFGPTDAGPKSTTGIEAIKPTATELVGNSGVTVLATVTGNDANTPPTAYTAVPVIVAFEKGTVINNVTLTNRAVIIGINMESWPNLTDAAKTIISRSIAWVTAGTSGIQDVISPNLLNKVEGCLVNPTNLNVEVYNMLGVKIIASRGSSISLNNLSQGVYMAKIARGTLKFTK